jgi:hypothetical protein
LISRSCSSASSTTTTVVIADEDPKPQRKQDEIGRFDRFEAASERLVQAGEIVIAHLVVGISETEIDVTIR